MTAETVAEQIQTLKGHICCHTEEEIDALVDAIRAELREQIATELLNEAARARDAHRAAQTNHFAHDYCRWVGHAEALTSAAARVARGEKP